MPSSMKDRGVSQQHDGYSRDRALSESGMLVSHEEFVPRHPILSMPDFTKLFGPLIFPLYRAALLRKRILMIGEAPVEFNCNLGKSMCNKLAPTSSNVDVTQYMISPSSPLYHPRYGHYCLLTALHLSDFDPSLTLVFTISQICQDRQHPIKYWSSPTLVGLLAPRTMFWAPNQSFSTYS